MKKNGGWLSCMVLAAFALWTATAAAQAPAGGVWPTRPVKIIVNYAPGGSTDNATRPYMERLSCALGQQVVIENRGGASGAVGVEAAVKSAPDGYTFIATPVASLTILPAARPTAYDPFRDLVPVAHFADSTLTIAVHPSVPARSLKELAAHARANPGKLSCGSSGLGTLTQMICEGFKLQEGIDILHVPYRGGADSLIDLLSGTVQIFMEGNVFPHVKAGKARLLAVVDSARHPDYPDVPTMQEVYPDLAILNWFALFAPTRTPDPIIRRMNAEMTRIAADPALQAHLLGLALRAHAGTPEQLGELLRRDYDLYGKMVRDLKLRMD